MEEVKAKKINKLDIIILVFFFLLVIITVFPLYWMLITAFKSPSEINAVHPTLFPHEIYLENFQKIFSDSYFGRYFLNSMISSVTVTVVSVLTSALVGYVFAKFKFPLKKVFFYAILATIMVPFESFIVPLYNFVRSMGAINTYFGIVFPSIISSFGIFFMKQNMEQIPDALIEAAKIDGAGNWFILEKIILPLSVSSISVISILLFITEWSSYLWPLIIATKKEMFVLEIGLTLLQDEYFVDYGMMMAGCVVALIPTFILFLIFRKNIMEGIASTGIKG